MDLLDNLKKALDNKKADIVPAISATSVAIFDSFDFCNVSWPQAHYNVDDMAKLGVSLHKLANLENARIPFDMTGEAQVFGCEIDMTDSFSPPVIKSGLNISVDDLDIPTDYINQGRLSVITDSIELLKNEYPNIPVIVGLVGPFTLAGQLFGIENVVKMLNKDMYAVETILDVVLEAQIELARSYSNAGADVVCVPDGSASPDLINPEDFREFEKDILYELSNSIKSQSIIHMCGNSRPILDDLLEIGFNGLSIEESINTGEALMIKDSIKSDTAIVGNVSSTKTLLTKTPNEVKKEVFQILNEGTDILAPSCGLAPASPLENIKTFVNSRNDYYN